MKKNSFLGSVFYGDQKYPRRERHGKTSGMLNYSIGRWRARQKGFAVPVRKE